MQIALLPTLAAALLPTLAPQTAPTPADAAARLIPADATIVIRADSVDGLLALIGEVAPADTGELPPPEAVLTEMGLPGDAGLVDTTRPVWIAYSMSAPMQPPQVTWVVAPRDADVFAGSVEGQVGWASIASGGYVGISQVQGYAELDKPAPAVAAMKPGLLAAHVELGTLIRSYRMFIDMGLANAEAQLDSMAMSEDPGLPVGPLLELYVDLARDLVDSAEGLDLSVARHGASLAFESSLVTSEGSPMAAWGAGKPVDLRAWPGAVDAGASISMAFAGDWASIMDRMQPLLDASFAIYPESTRKFFEDYMAACKPFMGLMGATYAGGEIGGKGMRLGYLIRSAKPAELVEAMSAVAQRFSGGEQAAGVSIGAPEKVQVAGHDARRFRMDIDFEALAKSMGEELPAGQAEKMAQAMTSLYGANGLQITLAPAQDAVIAAIGGDDAYAEQVLKAPATARGVPADLQHGLEAASGGSLGLVYRFDLGKLAEEIEALGAAMGQPAGELDALPKTSLPITSWMAVRGRTWTSGMALDVQGLASFVSAIAAGAPAEEAEPFVYEIDEDGGDTTARASIVQAELALIEASMQLYSINNGGRYPESLDVLVVKDENGESYLDEIPADPWGHDYVYEAPDANGHWRLLCLGSDGQPGGEGEAADIVVQGDVR